MENKIIFNVEDLDNFHQKTLTGCHQNLFRGHAKDDYKLKSTLHREIEDIFGDEINLTHLNKVILEYERFLHIKFKEKVINKKIGDIHIQLPSDEYKNFLTDWYLLFQERHLELPTRLIDWSDEPKIALYFAVNNSQHWDKEGHIWVFRSIHNHCRNTITNIGVNEKQSLDSYEQMSANSNEGKELLDKTNPFDLLKDLQLHLPYSTEKFESQIASKRRLAQRGRFLLSKNTDIEMTFEEKIINVNMFLEKLIIPANCKENIYKELVDRFHYDDMKLKILPEIPENTKKIIDSLKQETADHIRAFYNCIKR